MKNKKKISIKWKIPVKWTIFGLTMGVVLATVGSIAALNGWFGGGGQIPEDTMIRGLVGYWGFEEGSGAIAHDSSNYANGGTLTSGPSWTNGKIGGALQFDGSDDYVARDSGVVNIGGGTEFSAEAWVKRGSTTGEQVIWAMGQTNLTNNAIFYFNTDNTVGFYLYDDTAGRSILTTNTLTNTSSWHHIVGTYNAGAIQVYVDGVEWSGTISGTETGTMSFGTTYLRIGNRFRSTTPTGFFNGLIDEVKVYNRALSDAEVRYHYNRGGPVAHWKFDEGEGRTAYDSTENNNDGTLVLAGSATSSAWVSGKYGSALSFDGVDDFISLGQPSTLDITGTITFETWFKPNALPDSGIFISRDNITNRYAYFGHSSNNAIFYLLVGGVWDGIITNTSPFVVGSWYHIVGTYDGAKMSLYINGQLVESLAKTGALGTGNVDWFIGKLAAPGDERYLNGVLDDVRIYNYARTPEEIRLDYNAGYAAHFGPKSDCKRDPGSCMTQGLVGYWGFEEGSGITAHDASNYVNTGTLTAGPSWTKGKIGTALQFDGTDDYVNMGNHASINPGSEDFTIEGWFKVTGYPAAYDVWLANTTSGGLSSLVDTDRFSIGRSLISEDAIFYTTIPTNQWFHIVVTRTGGVAYGYYNGQFISSSAFNFTLNTGNVVLGVDGDLASLRYQGLIDEARIYNRALSAEEVRYHYNRGGPVGHWKFDEGEGRTAYDSTDNNNDGTLVLAGSATSSAWVSGKYGSALSFDGADDYVATGNNTITNGSTGITVAAWFKLNALGAQQTIVDRGYTNPWRLTFDSDNTLFFRVYLTTAGSVTVTTASPLDTNWHHAVATFDSSSGICIFSIYIDGVLAARVSGYSGDTILSTATRQIFIGSTSGATHFLNGLIDDVRIYNYARTLEEIRLDYNAGFAAHFGPTSASCSAKPSNCMTEGLVGYWDFEEGSGTIAHDASNYANNGTLTSGPLWTKGKVGGALSFDGADDYVTLGNGASLNINGQAISVCLWMAGQSTGSGVTTRILIEKKNWQGLRWIQDTRVPAFQAITDVGFGYVAWPTALTYGQWYFVCGTYDGTTSYIYVDGVRSAGVAITGNISVDANDYIIGDNNAHDRQYNGLIDEVKIYNRALSAEEIRYHYNRGGPVAQWKFDEGEGRTAYDSTDNNNDGTLILAGSATSSAWVSGKYGSALSFDGVDDYVAKDSGVTNMPSGGQITLEAWFYSNISGAIQDIVACGDYAVYTFWLLRWDNTDKVHLYVGNSADSAYAVNWTSTNTVSKQVWHHIAATYNNGASPKTIVYLDGVAMAGSDTGAGGNIATPTTYLGIGAGDDIHINKVNGLIDEVRIYNYARTPLQIQQDYNQGLSAHFK